MIQINKETKKREEEWSDNKQYFFVVSYFYLHIKGMLELLYFHYFRLFFSLI